MRQRVATHGTRKDNQAPFDSQRIILPFMGSLTYRLTSYLRNKLDCEFGYLPGRKLGQILCSHKERKPPEKIGIYQIPCSCKANYIGETLRSLETRIKEHQKQVQDLSIRAKKNQAITNSAIADHINQNKDHQIMFDSASLLEHESRYFHRKSKEGLYIQALKPEINRDKGSELSPIWGPLLLPLFAIRKVKNPP